MGSAPVKKIAWVFSDVDGVLTDAGVYYSPQGEALVKFNRRDGMGFEMLRTHGFKVGLLTKERSPIVEQRATKLKVDACLMGIEDKLKTLTDFLSKADIPLSQVAYIGDDVNDTPLLKAVGFAAAPADACRQNLEVAGIMVCVKKGGDGAFREFAEAIIALSS